jgi:D-3-phosphoglycerate dehydrogenase / 2-oxoglutarate reductase
MKVLITCPPMIAMIDKFRDLFGEKGIDIYYPEMVQALSEDKLLSLVRTAYSRPL